MNKDIITGVLVMLTVMPIWFYLLYCILVRVNASELMWFLYWVYVPAALVAAALSRIAESDK